MRSRWPRISSTMASISAECASARDRRRLRERGEVVRQAHEPERIDRRPGPRRGSRRARRRTRTPCSWCARRAVAAGRAAASARSGCRGRRTRRRPRRRRRCRRSRRTTAAIVSSESGVPVGLFGAQSKTMSGRARATAATAVAGAELEVVVAVCGDPLGAGARRRGARTSSRSARSRAPCGPARRTPGGPAAAPRSIRSPPRCWSASSPCPR